MSVVKKIKTPDGTIMHTLDGKLHNYDGPAIVQTPNTAAPSSPLISVPSLPAKNQIDACKSPCRSFIQIKRIYNFAALYPKQTRQWNLKKA